MHINRFKVSGLCYKFCRTSPTKIASFTGLVGAWNELHESEASEASVFCFDNLPLKNLASWTV